MKTQDLTHVTDIGLLDDLRHSPGDPVVLAEVAKRWAQRVVADDAELQEFCLANLHKVQGGKVGRIFDGAVNGISRAIADRGCNKKGEGPTYQVNMQLKMKGVFAYDEELRAHQLSGIQIAETKVTSKVPPAAIDPVLMTVSKTGKTAFNVDKNAAPNQRRLPGA